MSMLSASCPSCAAPIEFKKGSTIVIVCPFCRSAVARTDRALEDLGKVAEIADSNSPLKIGLKGIYKGQRFELTGRAQLRHEMGGFWDEWYATFSNGWVGWLAEAQGRFYMTFYQPLPEGTMLPSFEQLNAGQNVPQIPANSPFMVSEKGIATAAAAEGEIPYKLIPGEQSRYADLVGKDNAFATIDYNISPPWVFVGNQVSLDDIGLGNARPQKRESAKVAATSMGCPKCGGPLKLNIPDQAERIGCPYCGSLLDVNNGDLKFFQALKPSPDAKKFVLPIGAEGTFPGDVKFKIIGAMTRSVTLYGETYFWHEYLLYQPMVGFRWLVHSDNHWSFVEPVNPAEVVAPTSIQAGATARYNGKRFNIFQDARAQVRYVQGEFYWKVTQGETVRAIDFVSPPLMLSQESTPGEINWSCGVYMTNSEIENIFGIKNLPKPWSVAPNQPYLNSFYYTWGFLPAFILIVLAIFMIPLTGITGTAHVEKFTIPAGKTGTPSVIFSQPFELAADKNVRITAEANVSNSWTELEMDLINEESQEIESLVIPIEFYFGTDSDGSWTEGSKVRTATLSSVRAGKYTLRIAASWNEMTKPMPISIKVEQGVIRGVNFIIALAALLFFPVIGLFRKLMFENKRWSESMFTSSGG